MANRSSKKRGVSCLKNSVKISDIVVNFTIEAPNEKIIDAEIEFVKSYLANLLTGCHDQRS